MKKATSISDNRSWWDKGVDWLIGEEDAAKAEPILGSQPAGDAVAMLDKLTYGNVPQNGDWKIGMAPMSPWKRTPNLPMDEASRTARKMEQGYTTPVYHGTKAREDFREFRDVTDPHGDFGIHVTPSAETADNAVSYLPRASESGIGHRYQRIMPLDARIQKSLEMPDIGLWRSPEHWSIGLTDPRQVNMVGLGPYHSSIPTNDPETLQQIHKLAQGSKREWVNNDFVTTVKGLLQNKGYDSIKYKNYAEGSGEPSYLLLDPSQVKSRFAAFDPKAFGKTKDIMAGLALALGFSDYNTPEPPAPPR